MNSKHYNKCQFAMKFIQLSTIFNLFPSEIVWRRGISGQTNSTHVLQKCKQFKKKELCINEKVGRFCVPVALRWGIPARWKKPVIQKQVGRPSKHQLWNWLFLSISSVNQNPSVLESHEICTICSAIEYNTFLVFRRFRAMTRIFGTEKRLF